MWVADPLGAARYGGQRRRPRRRRDLPACVCLAARVGRLWRTSAWAAREVCAFVFRSCRLVGGCLGIGRPARSLVLVASASVASALLRDGWARVGGLVGGQVAMQCVVELMLSLLLLLSWWMCAAAGRLGWAC